MTAHMNHRGPRKRLIDLDQGYEVRYWTRQFDCSVEELCNAVDRVGNSAAAVRRVLKRKGRLVH